jgi:uncharacterized phage-associated protein
MSAEQKIKYFEYFLDKLYNQIGDNNDLSIVKTQKLLYFLSNSYSVGGKYPLFDVFDKFYALPYGHVESEIYKASKGELGGLLNFKIDRFGLERTIPKSNIVTINEKTELIDKAFNNLLKTELLVKSSSYLVDLSHCHDSWIKNHRLAKLANKLSHPIDKSELNSEMKYFSL